MPERVAHTDELAAKLEMLENILNNMDTAVYVSELATNKILFANMALRQLSDEYSLIGRLCWEALRNESERCGFCKIPYLLKNPGKGCHWELCMGGSRFQMYDNIIPWVEGKLVHMQCIVEIAE